MSKTSVEITVKFEKNDDVISIRQAGGRKELGLEEI